MLCNKVKLNESVSVCGTEDVLDDVLGAVTLVVGLDHLVNPDERPLHRVEA